MSWLSQLLPRAVPLALLSVVVACTVDVGDLFLAPGEEDPRVCDEGDCAACNACAAADPCLEEFQALQGADALAYTGCTSQCADPACLDACAQMVPEGAAIYSAFQSCQACVACVASCGGAGCK